MYIKMGDFSVHPRPLIKRQGADQVYRPYKEKNYYNYLLYNGVT